MDETISSRKPLKERKLGQRVATASIFGKYTDTKVCGKIGKGYFRYGEQTVVSVNLILPSDAIW